jgi:hypothetical protein
MARMRHGFMHVFAVVGLLSACREKTSALTAEQRTRFDGTRGGRIAGRRSS